MTRILFTGKTGQAGYELERSLQGLGEIIALDRSQMDFANLAQVRDVIRSIKPYLIVNPAAYTAVDKAESEPDLAMRINGEAPRVMAEEAKKLGAAMIHYSTDYVFDDSKTMPYVETHPTCSINVYGATKLASEQAIKAAGIPHLILRTILRLAQEREELRIVADQYGAPTWYRTIADTTAYIIAQAKYAQYAQEWWQERTGLYHLTAQGRTTWYEFTQIIVEHPSITKKPIVTPIKTQSCSLPAKRPSNSLMSYKQLIGVFCGLPDWKNALRLCQE